MIQLYEYGTSRPRLDAAGKIAKVLNVTIRNGELNHALLYLNKSELAVYHLIKEAPQSSRQKMAEKIGISPRTIDRVIQSLVKKDLIKREGSKKTGYWKINR